MYNSFLCIFFTCYRTTSLVSWFLWTIEPSLVGRLYAKNNILNNKTQENLDNVTEGQNRSQMCLCWTSWQSETRRDSLIRDSKQKKSTILNLNSVSSIRNFKEFLVSFQENIKNVLFLRLVISRCILITYQKVIFLSQPLNGVMQRRL